jgi:Helix-turn-helix
MTPIARRATLSDRQARMTLESRDGPQFGNLLQRYRLSAGLSQEDLAERAWLSQRGISDLNGEPVQYRVPQLSDGWPNRLDYLASRPRHSVVQRRRTATCAEMAPAMRARTR